VERVETGHSQHSTIEPREGVVVFDEENAFPMTNRHAGVHLQLSFPP